jgi:DNA modification methylase
MKDEASPKKTDRRERRSLAQQASPETRIEAEDPAVAEILRESMAVDQDDDGRRLTHGFHAWPARMHPTTAERLVATTPADSIVFDPFMGGGTVALEALVGGRRPVGRDVNPVALEVAWARTRHWDAGQRETLLKRAATTVERARKLRAATPRVPANVWATEGEWYDPPALHEVWSLAVTLRDAKGRDTVNRALRACLSSIIVKASKQASDSVPVADRSHRFVPPKRVEGWFLGRVKELTEGLASVASAVSEPANPDLRVLDARTTPPGLERSVHTIITSPPYPGVYDYVAHHQRRYGALDASPAQARGLEIGARRDVKAHGWRDAARRFQGDMTSVLKVWREVLVPEGRAYVVIGDGQYPRGIIRVLPRLKKAAESSGLKWLGQAAQERATWKIGGQSGKTGRNEYLVALERPR